MDFSEWWLENKKQINNNKDKMSVCLDAWGAGYKAGQVEPEVKPVDYGTCKNCIFNLEESETSLSSECQLTVDEFTGIGVMFSRDFGCNQWQAIGLTNQIEKLIIH